MKRRIVDLDVEELENAARELDEALNLWTFTRSQQAKLRQALSLIRLTLYRAKQRAANAEVAS